MVALAAAEPEADPQLMYSNYLGYPYAHTAYNTYAHTTPYVYSSAYNYYNPYFAYHRLFKRDAEAEPEADPYYFYNALPYTAARYPYYNFYNNHYPYYTHATYAHAAVAPVAAAAVHPAVPAVPGGYAAAGRYVAKSGSTVHIAKREADPEADPAWLYTNAYAHHPYAYRSFAYNQAFAPVAYSYYNRYNNYAFNPYRFFY